MIVRQAFAGEFFIRMTGVKLDFQVLAQDKPLYPTVVSRIRLSSFTTRPYAQQASMFEKESDLYIKILSTLVNH